MADQLLSWARGVIEQYRKNAVRILGMQQPGQVNIVVDDSTQVASTDIVNGVVTIHLNAKWFAQHPTDAGAVMHEYAHAIVDSNATGVSTSKQDWLAEGLADYTRDKLGLSTSWSSMQHGPAKKGSQNTAGFLAWLDHQTGGKGVPALAAAYAAGVDNPLNAIFHTSGLSGKQVTEAYNSGSPLHLTGGGGGAVPSGPAKSVAQIGTAIDAGLAALGIKAPTNSATTNPRGASPAGLDALGLYPLTGGAATAGGAAGPARDGDPVPGLPGWHYQTDPKTGLLVPVQDKGAGSAGSGAAKKKRVTANNVGTFTTMVESYGIDANGNVDNLIQKAAQQGWNSARFLQALQQIPEFHDRFPGIFDQNGNLKMTPQAYIDQEKSYNNIAAQYGLNVGPGKVGYLFRNDVSPEEFQTRATAIQRIRDNSDMFKAFGQQLAQEGLAPKGGLSKGDLFKFVLGQGNKEWYTSYNDTLSRYYGQQAGIRFGGAQGKYLGLKENVITDIAGKGLSDDALSTGYKDLANQLTTTMPLSQIQKFGLSKQDLVELEFGGKRQAAVALKVKQILANEGNIEDQTNKAGAIGGTQIAHQGGGQQARAQS